MQPRRPGFSNLRCQLSSGNSNDLPVLDDGGSGNDWATRGLVNHGPVHHRESQSSLTRNRATGAQRDRSGPMRFRDLVTEIGEIGGTTVPMANNAPGGEVGHDVDGLTLSNIKALKLQADYVGATPAAAALQSTPILGSLQKSGQTPRLRQ